MRQVKPMGLWAALTLTLALTGCNVSINEGGQRLEGAGVVFVVPLQSNQAQFGPGGIDYRSDTVTASTDGQQLQVNGRAYGALQAGDVVDLTDPNAVSVNGQARAPSGP